MSKPPELSDEHIDRAAKKYGISYGQIRRDDRRFIHLAVGGQMAFIIQERQG